jgi:protein arginine kinase activator
MHMLCVECKKNEAVVHYAEVVDSKITKLDLCDKCASEKGLWGQSSFSMGDLLGGFAEKTPEGTLSLSCSECKMTLEDFRKRGRLGCDHCYEVFKESLLPMIEQIHRSTQHRGKVPSHHKTTDVYEVQENLEKKKKCRRLEDAMRKAIENEDFEKAAMFRDKLKVAKEVVGL